jgi:hypothetical protein
MDEQTGQASHSSGSEDALRELAARLLAFRFGQPAGDAAPEPRLLVGELPPDMPVELPLPEDGRLLGSFIQEHPILAVDTGLTGADVIDFYLEQLGAAGWTEQERFLPHRGGFVHSSSFDRQMATFFSPDERYTMSMMAAPASHGRTTVQLTLTTDTEGFRPRQMPQGRDVMAVLPPIRPPRGALQMPEGGGGGPDQVTSSARLDTDLDLTAVSTHYLAELERAGWRRLDAGTSGPAAWSAWSFADEEGAAWQALLFILQRPGRSGKYALTLRAEAEDGAQQRGPGHSVVGGTWISSTGTHAHWADAPRPEPKE